MNKSKSFNLYRSYTDIIGATSSTLCMLHCLLTPFLFAVHATSSVACSEIGPLWWKIIDFLFLFISIVAIRYTAKATSLEFMPTILYVTWVALAILVINNFFNLLPIPHAAIYIPAMGLAALHLYNRKYCRCKEDSCCAV